MAIRKKNQNEEMEEILAGQLPEVTEEQQEENNVPEEQPTAASYLGQKLQHNVGGLNFHEDDDDKEFVRENGLSKIGDNINKTREIREGWMEVDRALLQERNIFYPEDWVFRIKPATVISIRNWSTIDDESPATIDTVFNEIMKECVSIITPNGPIPWDNINSWDRFFFILLVREYSFIKGESKIEYEESCINCDNPVIFTLNSLALDFELPDSDILRYYNKEERYWYIDPSAFGVDGYDPIELYIPNLSKDQAIKNWMIERMREKRKVDEVFARFLPWLAPKLPKDPKIASKKIREIEMDFKQWDEVMFSFMNDVIRNIMVIPSTVLKTVCPTCGEEVTSPIQFRDGIKSLFSISNRYKKFGSK